MTRKKATRAKSATRPAKDNGPKWPLSGDGLPLYKTSRSVLVECQAVAMELTTVEQRIRGSIDWPDPPTYVARVGGPGEDGDDVEQDYNEDSIKDGPPEDQERWAAYMDELTQLQADLEVRLSDARIRFFAIEGVKIVEGAPTIEEWAKRYEFISGVPAPTDPLEAQVDHFVDTCLGNIGEDLMNIYLGVSMASGADQERIEALEGMFRSEIQEAQATAWGNAIVDSAGDSSGEEQASVDG